MGFVDRLKHGWNAFISNDANIYRQAVGSGYSANPDRIRFSRGNERSIIAGIYNRIALDVSQTTILHAKLDYNGRFVETIDDNLNQCLTVEANIDQSSRAFIQDIAASMLDEGVIAIVPIETTFNPLQTGGYDINNMRVGQITEWYPQHVRVRVYNERTGQKEEVILPKKMVGIVENPFYSVMNEHSSVSQRLNRKLVLLDAVDEQSGSGKLDLIIQLPYIVKSEARRIQAENRRKEIEKQLASSKYGIAYTDGTEKVTQLNRSLENNLLNQVQYLQDLLYSQFGITQGIMDGTADENAMTNYYSRTIEPILSAIADEMKRKFLTKTARTQKQTIYFYRDPFKLIPVNQIAEMADKMTRNEIMTSNEFRQIIGLKPSDDPSADELRNKNLNKSNEEMQNEAGYFDDGSYESQMDDLDAIDRDIAQLEEMIGGQ